MQMLTVSGTRPEAIPANGVGLMQTGPGDLGTAAVLRSGGVQSVRYRSASPRGAGEQVQRN